MFAAITILDSSLEQADNWDNSDNREPNVKRQHLFVILINFYAMPGSKSELKWNRILLNKKFYFQRLYSLYTYQQRGNTKYRHKCSQNSNV